MAKSGPQRYPGASTAAWYQDTYGGDAMEVNVVVLHTTEGRSLPGYGGGASAPNLTAVPDLAAGKLRWFQHFDIDTSSRALVNRPGGVATNTLNVCQVELVGTCDPVTHREWVTSPHVFWPQAPEWALAELAAFLRWMHEQHGVPLTGPKSWPAYPGSYGATAARFDFDEWNAFAGICGHLHVPENSHGDPGAIDFTRLLALAKEGIEEDDMPLTDQEIDKVADRVVAKLMAADVIPAVAPPDNNDDWDTNKTWTYKYAVQTPIVTGRETLRRLKGVEEKVNSLAVGGVDLDAVAAKVADLLAARLAQ